MSKTKNKIQKKLTNEIALNEKKERLKYEKKMEKEAVKLPFPSKFFAAQPCKTEFGREVKFPSNGDYEDYFKREIVDVIDFSVQRKGGLFVTFYINPNATREKILFLEVSTTLDAEFCIRALERALTLSSPEIFNSDQGSQFTSVEFTGRIERLGVAISMDGRGRAMDNIFVERLWRTVKEARESLARYFHFYNTERLHESLGYRTPQEAYFKEGRIKEDSGTKPVQADLHQIQPSFLS